MTQKTPYFLLACFLLAAGCNTMKKEKEEVILTDGQQEAVLSKVKPPQQYGFAVFPFRGGIAMNAQPRLHPNHVASVSMRKDGVPAIKMSGRASRMKLTALLDFTSPNTWIEFGKSQEFDAVFLGLDDKTIPYRGAANTGGVDAYSAVVTQMRIKQFFIENVPLYVRMALNSLGSLDRNIEEPHIDAVLGFDVLRHFEYIRFDFAQGTIGFSASIPYTPSEQLLMTEARIVPANGRLAVLGAIDGEPTPVLLDFSGDYHFQRSDARTATTGQVSLGEVVFLDEPTQPQPGPDIPRAGRRMLMEHTVTICPRAGVVYFERPVE